MEGRESENIEAFNRLSWKTRKRAQVGRRRFGGDGRKNSKSYFVIKFRVISENIGPVTKVLLLKVCEMGWKTTGGTGIIGCGVNTG